MAAVVLLPWVTVAVVWVWLVAPDRPDDPERAATVSDSRQERPGGDRTHGPDAPATRSGIERGGVHVSVAPDEFGDLEVVERVVVARPVGGLTVAPPPAPSGSTDRPVLTDLQVTADGAPVPITDEGDVDDSRSLTLLEPATKLVLRYRVLQADERSASSLPGRATLSVRPATYESVGSLPAVLALNDTRVHNLLCLQAPRSRRLCGIEGPDGWSTQPVPSLRAVWLALVDLPRPG